MNKLCAHMCKFWIKTQRFISLDVDIFSVINNNSDWQTHTGPSVSCNFVEHKGLYMRRLSRALDIHQRAVWCVFAKGVTRLTCMSSVFTLSVTPVLCKGRIQDWILQLFSPGARALENNNKSAVFCSSLIFSWCTTAAVVSSCRMMNV